MQTLAYCTLALVLSAPLAQADIYKWIDSTGAVHYASEKPAGVVATTRVDSSTINVYTPPVSNDGPGTRVTTSTGFASPGPSMTPPAPPPPLGMSAYPPSAAQTPWSSPGGYPAGQPDAAQLAQWKAQCEREMWADCNDPRTLAARYGVSYGPAVVVVRPHMPPGVPGGTMLQPRAGMALPGVQGNPLRPRLSGDNTIR